MPHCNGTYFFSYVDADPVPCSIRLLLDQDGPGVEIQNFLASYNYALIPWVVAAGFGWCQMNEYPS